MLTLAITLEWLESANVLIIQATYIDSLEFLCTSKWNFWGVLFAYNRGLHKREIVFVSPEKGDI